MAVNFDILTNELIQYIYLIYIVISIFSFMKLESCVVQFNTDNLVKNKFYNVVIDTENGYSLKEFKTAKIKYISSYTMKGNHLTHNILFNTKECIMEDLSFTKRAVVYFDIKHNQNKINCRKMSLITFEYVFLFNNIDWIQHES